jgi:hypothetical protein
MVVLVLMVASCSRLFDWGRDFPSPKPGSGITNGTTTKADLQRMFGDPYEVGMKDGDQTWTWVYGKKGTTEKEPDLSKRLDVTFDSKGVVKSHSFSSNFPDDMKLR